MTLVSGIWDELWCTASMKYSGMNTIDIICLSEYYLQYNLYHTAYGCCTATATYIISPIPVVVAQPVSCINRILMKIE